MTGGGRRLPVLDAGRLPDAEPPFTCIAIVGLGQIGASLGLAARQAWPKALVVGVDANDVLERAVRLHAVDLGADDLVVAAGADLLVLASTEAANLATIARLPEYLNGECTVTDVGASKRDIVDAATALPSRLAFVGGDPLLASDPAGRSPHAGLEAARAEAFRDRFWVLTPAAGASVAAGRLAQFVRGVGAIPVEMTTDRHDQLIPYLNHLREWSGL